MTVSIAEMISNSSTNPLHPLHSKPESLAASRYLNTIEGYSPAEMIQKFVSTAPKNVQAAAKSTVVNILGNLPDYALDAALITTSSKLANLLHQMQMTGYMFKNAEYRMNFIRPLKGMYSLMSNDCDIKIISLPTSHQYPTHHASLTF